jgi:antitoxin YqcF
MTASAPRPRRRAVARAARDAFGATGRPDVPRMWDAAERAYVDVLACSGTPDEGLTTYSTLTLHETTNLLDGRDIRVEIAGICRSDQPSFLTILATAALDVVNDAALAAPDVVMRDAVSRYEQTAAVRHMLLTEPFPFDDLASVRVDEDVTVHWLLAVPISEPELELALTAGVPALTRRLEDAGAPFYDLDRPSVA